MSGRSVACVVLLSVALIGGCSDLRAVRSDDGQLLAAPTGRGLVARSPSPVADLPMPIGFVMVQSRSRASVEPGRRMVTHVYQGRAAFADVIEFYRSELRRHGWRVRGERIEGQTAVTLTATKADEAARVEVDRRDAVITVELTIAPIEPPPNAAP